MNLKLTDCCQLKFSLSRSLSLSLSLYLSLPLPPLPNLCGMVKNMEIKYLYFAGCINPLYA